MKTTELIKQLQKLVKENGDKDIIVYSDGLGTDNEIVQVISEDNLIYLTI